MRITAALIWYDELPADLETCVRGVAEIADRIVAVDGAYARYPGAQIQSPRNQAETIVRTAREVGLEYEIHVPDRLWAGQVEKRSAVLARASKDTDWIAIVDTDWIVHGDRDAVRAELAGYGPDVDVVDVSFYTPPGDLAPATGWHRDVAGTRTDMGHFFRPLAGLRVEGLHWWYSAIKDGQRVWLWHGPDRKRPVLPHHRLAAEYEIEHRTLLRDERHVLASRAFCNDRVMVVAQTGQEDDVPGLPPPAFDYVTVPY